MRNMKKFLALVLAMLMLASTAVMTTSAADEADYTDAAQSLATLNIMKGDNGNLMLDQGVKRYQASLFFVQALTGKTETAIWNAEKNSATFADVIDYGTAIDYAAGLGIVKGIGGNEFGYNSPIKYQDMIVMAVRALGYETADMQYPYGHILAAQKLGIIDNIDQVNYKADLNRGETAQLIWDMLKCPVAVTDPLTNKILYPGESSLLGALEDDADKKAEIDKRVTLLEKAGYANDTVDAYIIGFEAADEDVEDSVDMITLNLFNIKAATLGAAFTGTVEIPAAALEITAETPVASYLGKPVELFVNYVDDNAKTAGFTTAAYEDEDVTIVFANTAEYETVINLGDGQVKVYNNSADPADADSYISLGGTKFYNDEYTAWVYELTDDGWVKNDDLAASFVTLFDYDTKDGYTATSGNLFGQFEYRVIDRPAKDVKDVVEILYTPFEFGQYTTRELKYAPSSKNETFTLVGQYTNNDNYTNAAGDATYFVEKFLDANNSTLASLTASVSESKGKNSLTVKLEGEAVQNGDFMIYSYNAQDNVLNVVKNLGTIQTGRLTAMNVNKETVKIGGTNYETGFAASFVTLSEETNVPAAQSALQAIINGIKAGKDNVQYLTVDGKVVFLEPYSDEEAATVDFAIISTADEIMADLLGMTPSKYDDSLTKFSHRGANYELYVADGYVVVAMLDLTTGEWKLANIKSVATDYNSTDKEFTGAVDVATLAKYAAITTVNDNNFAAAAGTIESGMVKVVEEKDGVYTVAKTNVGPALTSVDNENGLKFSAAGLTNAITADTDVAAANIQTAENTVIVVFDGDYVGVRTGVQNAKANVEEALTYYAAGTDLIVAEVSDDFDTESWGGASIASEKENYYVILPDVNFELETTEVEDEYAVTVSGLYDIKNFKVAEPVVVTVAKTGLNDFQLLVNVNGVGKVLKYTEEGELEASTLTYAGAVRALREDPNDFSLATGCLSNFDNATAIAVDGIADLDGVTPVTKIAMNVATLDLTGFDWKEVNMNSLYVDMEITDGLRNEYNYISTINLDLDGNTANGKEAERFFYEINLTDAINEIEEPVVGVMTNFDLYTMGVAIRGLDKDKDDIAFTVGYQAIAAYDEDTDTATIYVVKVLTAAGECDHEGEWDYVGDNEHACYCRTCSNIVVEACDLAEVADTAVAPALGVAGKEADLKCAVCDNEVAGAAIDALTEAVVTYYANNEDMDANPHNLHDNAFTIEADLALNKLYYVTFAQNDVVVYAVAMVQTGSNGNVRSFSFGDGSTEQADAANHFEFKPATWTGIAHGAWDVDIFYAGDASEAAFAELTDTGAVTNAVSVYSTDVVIELPATVTYYADAATIENNTWGLFDNAITIDTDLVDNELYYATISNDEGVAYALRMKETGSNGHVRAFSFGDGTAEQDARHQFNYNPENTLGIAAGAWTLDIYYVADVAWDDATAEADLVADGAVANAVKVATYTFTVAE